MRILMINPAYRAVTSKLGVGEQIPLGLLSIGGPLSEGLPVPLEFLRRAATPGSPSSRSRRSEQQRRRRCCGRRD